MNLEAKIDMEQKDKVYNGPLKEMRKYKKRRTRMNYMKIKDVVPLFPILKQWRTMDN